jgi:TolA-binding protein
MGVLFPTIRTLPRVLLAFLLCLLVPFLLHAQRPGQGAQGPTAGAPVGPVNVNISVRDNHGLPLDSPALVRLSATVGSYNVRVATQEESTARFRNVMQGEYEVEVTSLQFKTANEHLVVTSLGADVSAFIYLVPEGVVAPGNVAPTGVTMTPKLQSEIDKGMDSMHKHQFEAARIHFAKALQLAPSNPDVAYCLGAAELALHHMDEARKDFSLALKSNQSHEKALLALGELELRSGEIPAAIDSLEKAFALNGAGWRTQVLLASAYARADRLSEAETHAESAVNLAKDKGADAMLLLGEIQDAEGKTEDARHTWEQVIAQFPHEPAASDAKLKLAHPPSPPAAKKMAAPLDLPIPSMPSVLLLPPQERPWAPADVDAMEYQLALNAPCQLDETLSLAERRLNSQLLNFEKFTATEHIEHQEVDRYGVPGPVKERDFSYVVFVYLFKEQSLYLEESRNGGFGLSAFPTSLATTGLNSLGIAILQPAYRDSFDYRCEGLVNIRGLAAWQIHFEQKKGATAGIRQWRKEGTVYNIPLKGRIWISSTTYDVLRIITDLRAPSEALGLTKDHLEVDYGPVNFESGKTRLWLPWTAEMYMELHGHRYHHRHLLRDYMLFAVDTTHQVGRPKDSPTSQVDSIPN